MILPQTGMKNNRPGAWKRLDVEENEKRRQEI